MHQLLLVIAERCESSLIKFRQMKTIKMFFAVLATAIFFAACNNTGNNQQQDADTTYMEPAPAPPVDDTMMNDTL